MTLPHDLAADTAALVTRLDGSSSSIAATDVIVVVDSGGQQFLGYRLEIGGCILELAILVAVVILHVAVQECLEVIHTGRWDLI
jgi:hypothetical protein